MRKLLNLKNRVIELENTVRQMKDVMRKTHQRNEEDIENEDIEVIY